MASCLESLSQMKKGQRKPKRPTQIILNKKNKNKNSQQGGLQTS